MVLSKISIVSTCEQKKHDVPHAKDYSVGALRLANSIRINGGLFNECSIYLWYDSRYAPDEDIQGKLTELGCILVPGEQSVVDPLFSKVQAMTTCSEKMATDYLLWLDSDMLVVNGLDVLVDFMGVDVAATATEKVHHRLARKEDLLVWKDLCDSNDVSFERYSELNLLTMMDNEVGLFNFNSGVVLARRASAFLDSYSAIAQNILIQAKGKLPGTDYCFDATAVALAVLRENLSWGKLPMILNHYFALHQEVLPDTAIVHYQDNDLGDLFPSLWNL